MLLEVYRLCSNGKFHNIGVGERRELEEVVNTGENIELTYFEQT